MHVPQPTNYLKPTHVLSQSPYLEFRVVHPLEHGLGAGLAAGSGSGAVEGGEEAARRGAEEGGAPAPPEERQDLRLRRRRHGELSGWYGLGSLRLRPLAGDQKPAECRWIDEGWATFLSGLFHGKGAECTYTRTPDKADLKSPVTHGPPPIYIYNPSTFKRLLFYTQKN